MQPGLLPNRFCGESHSVAPEDQQEGDQNQTAHDDRKDAFHFRFSFLGAPIERPFRKPSYTHAGHLSS